MSDNNRIIFFSLVLLGLVSWLFTNPTETEQLGIHPTTTRVVKPGQTMSQQIQLLPGTDEVRIFFAEEEIGSTIQIELFTDQDNKRGALLSSVEKTTQLIDATSSINTLVPTTAPATVWVSLRSPSDQPFYLLREIDTQAYPDGMLVLEGEEKLPGVVGFGLYKHVALPIRPYHIAIGVSIGLAALVSLIEPKKRGSSSLRSA